MLTLNVKDLLDYTGWEREQWHSYLREQGEQALEISAGPHGDGRFQQVGHLIQHVFSAEKRYVERLLHQRLTDPGSIPGDLEGLFKFGHESRTAFQHLLETFPDAEWDATREFKILTFTAKVTPRKIAMHVLMHEIRHWAQIGTILRLNGHNLKFHDFLFSPVLGGDFS